MAVTFDGLGEGRQAALPAARMFTEKGGWADLIEPHKGLLVDRLPAEWAARLRGITDANGYITLEAMAAVAVREHAATTVVDGKIDIRGFPEHLHAALRAFDPDGSGSVGAQELQHAAVLYSESQKTKMRMVRMLATLFVTVLAVCCAVAGLTYAVVEGTKEVRTGAMTPEGQVLATVGHGDNEGAPVATLTPSISIPLGAIAYIPEIHGVHGMLDKVELRNLMRADGTPSGRTYMTTITGFNVDGSGNNRTMTMYTMSGGMIHLASPADGVLTRRDGTEERFCGLCATCGAMNVAHTLAVDHGLKAMRAAAKASGDTCFSSSVAKASSAVHRRSTALGDYVPGAWYLDVYNHCTGTLTKCKDTAGMSPYTDKFWKCWCKEDWDKSYCGGCEKEIWDCCDNSEVPEGDADCGGTKSPTKK